MVSYTSETGCGQQMACAQGKVLILALEGRHSGMEVNTHLNVLLDCEC